MPVKKLNKKYIALLIATLFLSISACTVKDPIPNNGQDAIEKAINDGLKSNRTLQASTKNKKAIPSSIQKALMPELNVLNFQNPQTADTTNREPIFDVAVSNVPAKDFFMGLVKDTKYNMTVTPQIAGNISLELKSVTVPQTMEAVRDTYGFEYEKTSYGYKVFPRHLETRIFNINYLDLERNGQSQTTVGSGQITNTIQSTLTASGVTNSQQPTSAPSGLVQTSSGTKFWDLLKQNMETIIGTQEGRSIVINSSSGSIIVKAYPDELRHLAQYLDKIQNIIHRQVIIEAKVLEVQLNAQFQSGINWQILGLNQGYTPTSPNAVTTSNANSTTNSSANSYGSGDLPAFAPALMMNIHKGSAFSSIINLLNLQGSITVLSSPRIATINNQKAVIKVGNDRFFVTNVSSNTNNSGSSSGSNTTANITLTPFFSGISLDVTPQIDENDNITIHIHPIISAVTKDVQTFTVNDQAQVLPLASSTTRESDSIVRAKNGQVIVIGGLTSSGGNSYQSSTPGVDRVPGVGELFKNKNKLEKKMEIVILLKATIPDGANSWQKELQEAASSVKKMKGGDEFGYKIVPTKLKR